MPSSQPSRMPYTCGSVRFHYYPTGMFTALLAHLRVPDWNADPKKALAWQPASGDQEMDQRGNEEDRRAAIWRTVWNISGSARSSSWPGLPRSAAGPRPNIGLSQSVGLRELERCQWVHFGRLPPPSAPSGRLLQARRPLSLPSTYNTTTL